MPLLGVMTLINGEDVVGISVVVDTPFNLFPKLYIPNTLKVSLSQKILLVSSNLTNNEPNFWKIFALVNGQNQKDKGTLLNDGA